MEIEELVVKKESTTRKRLILLLKIAVTAFCFWYISRKIDFVEAKNAILSANWLYLLLALLVYMFGKFISSFRLNIYFSNIGLHLPHWNNIKLYWLGMYYNLFLPGSISGDAYKMVVLTKKFNLPYKKTATAILWDRFSGILALGLILAVYGAWVLDNKLYEGVLIGGSIMAIVVMYIVVRFFLKDLLPGFWPTFLLGIVVQTCMVLCIYCIMLSLNVPLDQSQWIFIFLIASVILVAPISLGGGLGTREVIFIEGAKYFGLDPHIGVVISLLYYLCTVLSSVWGLYFVFNDPLKEIGNSDIRST